MNSDTWPLNTSEIELLHSLPVSLENPPIAPSSTHLLVTLVTLLVHKTSKRQVRSIQIDSLENPNRTAVLAPPAWNEANSLQSTEAVKAMDPGPRTEACFRREKRSAKN